jgi:hypothetical protein
VISFRTHRNIDLGVAAMVATMPEFLAFNDDPEKRFFVGHGVLVTAITQLTLFREKPGRADRKTKQTKAA